MLLWYWAGLVSHGDSEDNHYLGHLDWAYNQRVAPVSQAWLSMWHSMQD